MLTRTIHPIHVLYFETKTSLKELSQHVRHVARKIYQEAVRNDLEITGPVYWVYEGADGNPETIFSLTIALPVSPSGKILESEFKTKYLEEFNCVTEQLFGDWNGLGKVYGSLISDIFAEKKTLSGQNREVYINMDFENPERNVTEVQIGIL